MEWPLARLGSVVDRLTNGFVGATRNIYKDKGVPYLLARQVKNNILKFDGKTYVSDEFNTKNQKSILKKGDVLLVQSGHIGHSAVVPSKHVGHNCHAMIVITPKNNLMSEFLSLYFSFLLLTGKISEIRSGSTVPHLTCKLVKELKIPLPPINEQKRIVAILDQAFAEIEKARANAEQNLKNARELFESYLQQVFSQRGDGWMLSTLGEAYDVRDGTHDSPKYQPQGRALITSKNLKSGLLNFDKVKYISEEDYLAISKRSEVSKGDVLMAMIGTIGNPVVITDEPNYAIKNVALFKTSSERSGVFLAYYLRTQYVIGKMMNEAKGTTQKFVGLGYLRQFPIWLPPVEIESEMIANLEKNEIQILPLEDIYAKKIQSLDELKKSILQKAFTGELTK